LTIISLLIRRTSTLTDYPIIPPPEMVNEWVRMLEFLPDKQVFSEVAQWGADQELEACCAEMLWQEGSSLAAKLRDRRRPKPPSLKEQALKALKVSLTPEGQITLDITDLNTIRRALEALPND
jgi:hypothetical protein